MRIVKKVGMLYNFFCAHSMDPFIDTVGAWGALAGRTAGVPQPYLFFSLTSRWALYASTLLFEKAHCLPSNLASN